MVSILLTLSLLNFSLPANAVTWRSFCERWLAAPDPYQYEDHDTDAVAKAYLREGARAYWSRRQSSELRVIGDELRSRARTPEIQDLLDSYTHLEYRP